MLVIKAKDRNMYIAEDTVDDKYYITKRLFIAKDFKWSWLFFSKKVFLEGIQNKFPEFKWEYQRVK